jgi:glutathione S-transferase
MGTAVLTISSKNYSSWSLRGWLLCKFAGLPFEERLLPATDASARAELLHLSPSFLVPCLTHDGIEIWDVLAIAEYLAETFPEAMLLPAGRAERAHCRSVCAEMHGGFANLRSALPMNLKAAFTTFPLWPGAQADVDRILAIWAACFAKRPAGPAGPFLFGERTIADAMYAPVTTRFRTYGVSLDAASAAYCEEIAALPEMREWTEAAHAEADDVDELDAEF